jgi:hypothetical protein
MQTRAIPSIPEGAPPPTYQRLAIGVAWAIVIFLASSIVRMGDGRLELDSLIQFNTNSLSLFLTFFMGFARFLQPIWRNNQRWPRPGLRTAADTLNLALMSLTLIYIFELWLHASMIFGVASANPSFLVPFFGFAAYRISDYWPVIMKDRMTNAALT